MSLMMADCIRLAVDLLLYAAALLPAGLVFTWLWSHDSTFLRVLAFPAAYVALVIGFLIGVLALRVVFLRKIKPGTYRLTDPAARRWIIADSLMRMIQRSFLHYYIDEFSPLRFLFYRALGARIDRTFFFGWDAKILDPWAIEVGKNVIIGSFAVISAHSVEGDIVTIETVRIKDGATIGVRSLILPGVEVGERAIVGAGALVPKGARIPAGEVWAGVPARKIGLSKPAQSGADR